MTKRICPNPVPWSEVYQRLLVYARDHPCEPAEPPKPLILSGWSYSNDVEKHSRWDATINWAKKNGCPELVEIPDGLCYLVENPTSYTPGPRGGRMYRPWDYETKERPPDEDAERYLAILHAKWVEIAGNELHQITLPLQFSGSKMRRLVVRALGSAKPPWGGWTHRSHTETERSSFRKFRASINQAIAPHEVDHVEFLIIEDAVQIAAAEV